MAGARDVVGIEISAGGAIVRGCGGFGGGEVVILCLYVDDILIFENNETTIKDVKTFCLITLR